MDEYEHEEDNGDVGSPSPPYEGVIKEEPEKQLESKGGEFEEMKHENSTNGQEMEPQVNILNLKCSYFVLSTENFKLIVLQNIPEDKTK